MTASGRPGSCAEKPSPKVKSIHGLTPRAVARDPRKLERHEHRKDRVGVVEVDVAVLVLEGFVVGEGHNLAPELRIAVTHVPNDLALEDGSFNASQDSQERHVHILAREGVIGGEHNNRNAWCAFHERYE